jgi:hypothetical protein
VERSSGSNDNNNIVIIIIRRSKKEVEFKRRKGMVQKRDYELLHRKPHLSQITALPTETPLPPPPPLASKYIALVAVTLYGSWVKIHKAELKLMTS